MGKTPWKGTPTEYIGPKRYFDCIHCNEGRCEKKGIFCTKVIFEQCHYKEKPIKVIEDFEELKSFSIDSEFRHLHYGKGIVVDIDDRYLYYRFESGKWGKIEIKNPEKKKKIEVIKPQVGYRFYHYVYGGGVITSIDSTHLYITLDDKRKAKILITNPDYVCTPRRKK